MTTSRRSTCPINGTLELVGDRWTLLILRDMIFARKTRFREFQASAEGIATNILSARLTMLEKEGLVEKRPDPDDRRGRQYALTERGMTLIPLLLEMTVWGGRNLPGADTQPGLEQALAEDRQGVIAQLQDRLKQAP
jgi:DNA-binding HxlR family transcriptional regulator